ncbi:MAG: hypothetical protein ACU843_08275 [Gammaproteobacteria bacterium]
MTKHVLVEARAFRMYCVCFLQRPLAMRLRFLLIVVLLSGCSAQTPIETPRDFNPKTVTGMSFLVADYQASQLRQMDASQLNELSREISERFAGAGYPILNGQSGRAHGGSQSEKPDSSMQRDSHVLQASVGAVQLTEMPTGFTLDFGNADPRSQNFQKTTTVDITCRLIGPEDARTPIMLAERKAVPASLAEISSEAPQDIEKIRLFYVEAIGATCHDLLTRLDIYPMETRQTESEPAPLSGVRIETQYEQEPEPGSPSPASHRETEPVPETIPAENLQSTAHPLPTVKQEMPAPVPEKAKPVAAERELRPQNRPMPQKTLPSEPISKVPPEPPAPAAPLPAVIPDQEVGRASPAPVAMDKNPAESPSETAQEPSPPPLSTEQNETRDWRKKKITIFNQGNTVILKFGPDR